MTIIPATGVWSCPWLKQSIKVVVHHIKWRKYEVMAIAPSSAVTLAGAEQAVRAGIAAAQKSGVEWDEKILTLLL